MQLGLTRLPGRQSLLQWNSRRKIPPRTSIPSPCTCLPSQRRVPRSCKQHPLRLELVRLGIYPRTPQAPGQLRLCRRGRPGTPVKLSKRKVEPFSKRTISEKGREVNPDSSDVVGRPLLSSSTRSQSTRLRRTITSKGCVDPRVSQRALPSENTKPVKAACQGFGVDDTGDFSLRLVVQPGISLRTLGISNNLSRSTW